MKAHNFLPNYLVDEGVPGSAFSGRAPNIDLQCVTSGASDSSNLSAALASFWVCSGISLDLS